ncbi:hypothetical protein [Frankia sp. AgKG'84/4]
MNAGDREHPGSQAQQEQAPDIEGKGLPHDHYICVAAVLEDEISAENADHQQHHDTDGYHRDLQNHPWVRDRPRKAAGLGLPA